MIRYYDSLIPNKNITISFWLGKGPTFETSALLTTINVDIPEVTHSNTITTMNMEYSNVICDYLEVSN